MRDIGKIVAIIAQIIVYALAVVIAIQIIKKLQGGSWAIEDIMLSLIIANLTMTFGLIGYLLHTSSALSNKIASIDREIHGHLEWHKGMQSK